MFSASPVIKNIFTFANILSQSGTDIVGRWDEESVRNAFNWAAYCIKVEKETREKSYRPELDRHVSCLSVFLTPVCLTDLDLNKLKHADVLLCKRLLQNPDTPLAVVKHVSQVVDDPKLISECRGYRKRISYNRSLDRHLALTVTRDDGLVPVSLADRPLSSADQRVSVADLAQRVLDTLILVCKLHPDADQHRFLKFLSKLVQGVLGEDGGMELVANVLLALVREKGDHTAAESVKNRLLKTLVTPARLNSVVFHCEPGLLCRLSDRDDRFRRFHVSQLLTWGDSLVPSYCVTRDGNLYSWQYPDDDNQTSVFSFENLLRHVLAMLTYNARLKSALEPAVLERRGESFFNVWRDLLKGVDDRSD